MTKEQLIEENETLKVALKKIIALASDSHRKELEEHGVEWPWAYQCGEMAAMAAMAYASIADDFPTNTDEGRQRRQKDGN